MSVQCDITKAENVDLEQFPGLKWIDVSKNLISCLPGDFFKSHESLAYFSVAENPISSIGEGFFDHMPNLKKFSFSKTACLLGFTAGSVEEEMHEVIEECTSKKKRVKSKGRNKPTAKTISNTRSKPKSKSKMKKSNVNLEACQMTYLYEEDV
jgi:hypothetical protein